MRIKRVLQGTVLTAFAAMAWLSAGSAGAKASVTIADVTFNEENFNLEVKFTDPELMAGVASVDKNKKAKVSSWDVFELKEGSIEGTARIDLSKLNVVKDNYIAITTNDMDKPFYIKLAATAKKSKITFHGNTAKISNFKADSKEVEEVQYRRTTDGWTNKTIKLSETEFSQYQYQGAVLYFRLPGVNELEKVTAGTTETEETDATTDSTKDPYEELKDGQVDINTIKNEPSVMADVYNVGKLPGKEVKLNIAKQANGPSVPVDYKKCTVTINKNLEYRVIKESGIVSYAAVGSKSVKDTSEFLGTSDSVSAVSSCIVEVRKAALTNGKGKSASKWTRVKVEKPKAISFTNDTADISTVTTGKSVTLSTASGTIMEAAYKLNSKNTAVTHLVLTNKASVNYEYYLGSSVPAAGDKKIKTIKSSKAVNIKKADINGTNIYIRTAGDKKTKLWAGAWTKAGTNIKVPEIAAASK